MLISILWRREVPRARAGNFPRTAVVTPAGITARAEARRLEEDMSTRLLGFVLAVSALTMGCDGDGTTSPSAGPPLNLTFTGLTPLQGGFHYEGWAIIGGQPFSTGKFNVAA